MRCLTVKKEGIAGKVMWRVAKQHKNAQKRQTRIGGRMANAEGTNWFF